KRGKGKGERERGKGERRKGKGKGGKGKGERFQIHQTSCTRVFFALLWSKGYIFIGERENTKPLPFTPSPFPFTPSPVHLSEPISQ
ncbi:hypothetical protein VF11_36725, partial [Nostoc linckia z14]